MPKLNISGARSVDYKDTQLRIVENSNYELNLARFVNEETNEAEEIGLYEVILPDPFEVIYVLAESEKGAAGQATCYKYGSDSYENSKQREDKAIVRRLPLRIRGWGYTEF